VTHPTPTPLPVPEGCRLNLFIFFDLNGLPAAKIVKAKDLAAKIVQIKDLWDGFRPHFCARQRFRQLSFSSEKAYRQNRPNKGLIGHSVAVLRALFFSLIQV
jgi:hypothetical protein